MIAKKNLVGVLVVAAIAFSAGRLGLGLNGQRASAQDAGEMPDMTDMDAYMRAGTPSAHHEALNPLVGKWEGTVKVWMDPDAPPMVIAGTIERTWVLGGRFVHEVVEATSPFGNFEGHGYIGYNNLDGQYEFIWMENQSTAIMMETGFMDPVSQTIHTRGSHRDPVTGHVVSTRAEVNMSNPNRLVGYAYAVLPDGREFQSFEGVFERVE